MHRMPRAILRCPEHILSRGSLKCLMKFTWVSNSIGGERSEVTGFNIGILLFHGTKREDRFAHGQGVHRGTVADGCVKTDDLATGYHLDIRC